jgi:hypothetical protein
VSEVRALEVVPRHFQKVCQELDTSQLPTGRAEVSFAYDCSTGTARELGQHLDRCYRVRSTEIPGTADVFTVNRDSVHVLDYKTARKPPTASRSLQLRFLALCAARTYGVEQATGTIVQISKDGLSRDLASWDGLDLLIFEGELWDLFGRVQKARANFLGGKLPVANPGAHCQYCQAVCDARSR